MERVEQVNQSLLDLMKQNKQQQNNLPPSWTPSGGASSALSKSSSSAVMSSDGNIPHNMHGHSHDGSSIFSAISTQSAPFLKEHDYVGLAEVSSASSSASGDEGTLDVEDTDLRLGPGPFKEGLRSWQHEQIKAQPFLELLEAKEKINCTSMAYKDGLTSTTVAPPLKNGFKRAYGETLSEMKPGVNVVMSAVIAPYKQSQGFDFYVQKNVMYLSNWHAPSSDALYASTDTNELEKYESEVDEPPPAKVGWPPICSFRRNYHTRTHATQQGMDGEVSSAVYVKVNMDGMPIGRKVDLSVYRSYEALLAALEKMFDNPSSGNSVGFLSNGEFALTYEDQEGDWMLVGDVPWGMFVNMVRRLRIVHGSLAKGIHICASHV